jgi:hypothetical protein
MNIHDWGNLEIKGTVSLNKIFIPCNLSVYDTQSMNKVKKSHLLLLEFASDRKLQQNIYSFRTTTVSPKQNCIIFHFSSER